MSYATADDVAELLGRDLDPAETAIVSKRLDHAEALILSRIPDLPEKIADDPVLGRFLAMIETDAVIRLIRNPDGKLAESDGQYGYRVDQRVASGRLEILREEWELLGVRGVRTIALNARVPRRREEGDYDPLRGRSGPNTRDFEQGLDPAVWN